MESISRSAFVDKCHRLYDNLHGKKLVSNIFEHVTQKQLVDLVNIYYKDPLTRWNNIDKYLYKNNIRTNQATTFYVNALQHYICDD